MKVILKLQALNNSTDILLEPHKTLTFGRSRKCDVRVSDDLLSSRHCRLTLRPPMLDLEDLDSKNGTYLNGIRIEEAEIFVGDEIRIGNCKLNFEAEKMDPAAIQELTFPGSSKDRIAYSLVIDFDGARKANQDYFLKAYGTSQCTISGQNKELEIRKKIRSKIKLSKHEIMLKNKNRTSLANIIDVICLFVVVSLPLIFTNAIFMIDPNSINKNPWIVMVVTEIICVSLFYILNYKIFKFSIGEKLSGIQSAYYSQS